MRAWIWLIALMMIGSLTAAAAGREVYVSNAAGDDSFTGLQARPLADGSGPLRTIRRALVLANPGDILVLENTGSPYRESISLVGNRHSGYPSQPFVIRGNGATLDGSRLVPAHAWEHYRVAIFRFQPIRAGFQQLFLDERPAVRIPIGSTGSVPELKPLEWCMAEGWVYFCVEPDKTPADYKLTCADLQTGITLYHVSKVAICDLIVQGFQTDGISAFNSARDIRLSGVTCRGNGRSGISAGGASILGIEGCLAGNNAMAQVLSLPYSEIHVRGSVLLGNTAPGWVDQGGKFFLESERIQGGLDQFNPAEKSDGGSDEDAPQT